jgi:mRNA interferase HigB
MKVHLIKMQTIEDYILQNTSSRAPFDHWLTALKDADWHEPKDIIISYGSTDNLGNGTDRVVFNIGGNNYRMICKYIFGIKRVHLFICWIGTHTEYTKLCRLNKQYYINNY